MVHVPYKGTGAAITDLIGGQVPLCFCTLPSVFPHTKSGRLRAIAISSKLRSSVLPNVPTIAESGYNDFETTAWWGVFAPANLSADTASSLIAASEQIVRSDAFRSRLEPLGVIFVALTGGALADFQRGELAKWGKAVRDSGAAVDQF